MKRFFVKALILISALSSLKANAAYISSDELKPIIEKSVIKNCKQYTDADIKVESITMPFRGIDVPAGSFRCEVSSNASRFMPRTLEKVSVYVNNNCVKTFNAAVLIKAYKNVLVASTTINREMLLNESIVKTERREVSNIIDSTMDKTSLNNEIIAKKYFVSGELIDKRFVKTKPEVMRNSLVTVLFNTNNLTITTDATALSNGAIGDDICIMNKNYNKVYKGRVIGQNKVLVKI